MFKKKPKISIKVILKNPAGSLENKSLNKTITKSKIETKITTISASDNNYLKKIFILKNFL